MTWIAHHGIKGQKWGVRRYQNPDGTLTEAGKRRYSLDKVNAKDEQKKDRRLLKIELMNLKLTNTVDQRKPRQKKLTIL